MNRPVIIFVLIILVSLVSLSLAGIPKLINYQGMLTDNSGTPLSGTYNITFKIYNDPSAGTKEWEETQSSVSVTNGLFNVILGSVTPIDLDFSEDYWLDITVEGESMPSRLKFTSVGYAYRAKIADSAMVAVSAPTGGGWTDNGSVVRLTTGTDKVGIGTENPQAKLHISGGNVRLDYGSQVQMLQQNGYTSEIHWTGNDLRLANFATGFMAFYTGVSAGGAAYDRLHIANDGKVGIGTISPADNLHVANHIRVGEDATYPTVYGELKHDGGGTGFIINANAGGGGWADLHFQTNGTTKMFLESGGNLGIGTTNPHSKLHVNGSVAISYKYVIANYTATSSDCIIAVNATSGNRSIYLPTAAGIAGRVYLIKKTDASANSVIVDAYGDERIDGYAMRYLSSQWAYINLVSDGDNWLIIGRDY